jgi:hypothetical protein
MNIVGAERYLGQAIIVAQLAKPARIVREQSILGDCRALPRGDDTDLSWNPLPLYRKREERLGNDLRG